MAEIPNRSDAEVEIAAQLGKLSGRHIAELLSYLSYPPNINQVPEQFWRDVEDDRRREISAVLLLVFLASASRHGMQVGLAEAFGLRFAPRRAADVARSYVQVSRERLATKLAEIESDAASGNSRPPSSPDQLPSEPTEIEQRAKLEDIRQKTIDAATDVFSPERDASIAITETTIAQTAGAEQAAEVLGLKSEQDIWYTERDGRVCEFCGPLHAKPRTEWMASYPAGPPAHPNCRCWIQYANQGLEQETIT